MADVVVTEPLERGRTRRNSYLIIGSFLLAAFLAVAVFGGAMAPYDPNAQDLMSILEPPSGAHWFGADQVGRDILSRIIVGTRTTMMIALVSVSLAGFIGVSIGLAAGYIGGTFDRVAMVVMDLLLTVPSMVLAIAIVSAVGASATGLTAAITVSFMPPLARLVRSRVLELRGEDFVSAARTLGIGGFRILWRHILPNAVSVIVIELSLLAGQAVLVASALGFLGLGVQPPNPEWGSMLGAAREYLTSSPHLVFAPGLAITLLVFTFNMLGDGLRDRFDPNSAP
jgi:ABC-type dipeptide/oligopeptide/nickel transport system permease subunit